MFASLPGVSAPPPFGGNQRTIVVHVDPDRLRAYNLSPEEVVQALTAGNTISPSGNIRVKDQMPIVPVNSMVVNPQDLGNIPIRPGSDVYLRDLGVDRGQHRHPDRLRPGQRQPGRLHPRHQAGRRLDADGRQRGRKRTCRDMQAGFPRTSRSASSSTSRPTSRGPSGGVGMEGLARRRAHRPDGAAVPARLAERRSSSC